ncbi:MAG TPA: nickel-dependent hydrogenase large subunit [Anaerovoracaceae bacterium]|nr:nickel-dependent hydrogenase large subunit [Anaerovoracaceae bacterium]
MSERITINPVTRISGFMEIEAAVENHRVTDARVKGLMFRGFEQMLKGRNPFDAAYYTERICGICSTAHSLAATLALEQALSVTPTEQGRFLRDFMHGSEFLQNHLRHFYQFVVPDYVRLPEQQCALFDTCCEDFRLPEEKNAMLVQHYFDSLNVSREAHEMIAVFGGKAPHNHGVFVGGATTQATADKIVQLKTILNDTTHFIEEVTLPDAGVIAQYYPEYYQMGGGRGNFLSYGCFDNYPSLGTLYLDPAIKVGDEIRALDPSRITEDIDFSWYTGELNQYSPMQTIPVDDMEKPEAYSFIKSSKADNMHFEVGPLARQWLSDGYRHGISSMDRVVARIYEAKKIAEILKTLLDNMDLYAATQREFEIPASSAGAGMVDTTRGALGHWIKIENQLIDFYQVITPSVWNLSSRSNDGAPGTAEQALIGTEIENEENPVELMRIIRSFDPCVSCGTHVYYPDKAPKFFVIVP